MPPSGTKRRKHLREPGRASREAGGGGGLGPVASECLHPAEADITEGYTLCG